jgi:two-component system OmpR family sensor kinase
MLHKAHGRPEVIGRLADQIGASVQRTGLLIDGLLGFSRAEHRSGDEAASLRTTVAAVLEDLAAVIDRVDAAVDVDVPALDVRCAPGLLHIVVANLVGNALKFMENRPVRRVRIAAGAAEAWCELVVADTGPGIPREALARVFEPFYREPGNRAAGTGIGLATVQRIVEARGGLVTVESEPGRGATFRVRLPLCVRHAVVTHAQTAV